jgi:hypothetical protein
MLSLNNIEFYANFRTIWVQFSYTWRFPQVDSCNYNFHFPANSPKRLHNCNTLVIVVVVISNAIPNFFKHMNFEYWMNGSASKQRGDNLGRSAITWSFQYKLFFSVDSFTDDMNCQLQQQPIDRTCYLVPSVIIFLFTVLDLKNYR